MYLMDKENNTPFKDWDLANNIKLSFEDTMVIDIEKAIRKQSRPNHLGHSSNYWYENNYDN